MATLDGVVPESIPVLATRVIASFFILLLIWLSAMGWAWSGTHQPPAEAIAARIVLVLTALAGIVGLVALWRWPRRA